MQIPHTKGSKEHLSQALGFTPQLETTSTWTNFNNYPNREDFFIAEKKIY